MHSCQDIEENRYFSNGGTNLHIHAIAQGRPEDNQVEFLQGPHGIVNPPKNLVLNNIRRFTQMTNGLGPRSLPNDNPKARPFSRLVVSSESNEYCSIPGN